MNRNNESKEDEDTFPNLERFKIEEESNEAEDTMYDSFEPEKRGGLYEGAGYSYFSASDILHSQKEALNEKEKKFMFFQYGTTQRPVSRAPIPMTQSSKRSLLKAEPGKHFKDNFEQLKPIPDDGPAPMLGDLQSRRNPKAKVKFAPDSKDPSWQTDGGLAKKPGALRRRSVFGVSGRFGGNVTDQDLQRRSGLGIDEDAWDQSLDRCFEFQSAARHFLQERSNHQRGHALISAAKDLADLAQDFFNDAELYGRVIISEQFLPDEQKTIQPSNVGGVAGGEKYIIASRGIMFKFANDFKGVYGGDNWAQKAANHELRGLIALYNLSIPDLYFPLMAVIDYFGYRLLAVSILPVLGKTTLRYGSCDQGRSIQMDSPAINAKMQECGARLNLKPYHFHNKTMHICSDFEVHEGNPDMLNERMKRSLSINGDDQRIPALDHSESATDLPDSEAAYYICDMARVFPPCCVIPLKEHMSLRPPRGDKTPNMQLYRTFRPRFVATYPRPLCAESYSKMQDKDGMLENAHELMEAVRVLHVDRVREFALHLEQNRSGSKGTYPKRFDLTEELHKFGINVHLLGLVRLSLEDPKWRQICETEMLARIGKNLVRERLRERSKKDQVVSEVTGKEIIADVLTSILFDIDKDHYDFRHRYNTQIKNVTKFWDHDLKVFLQEAFFDHSILYFQSNDIKQTAVDSFVEDAKKSLARDMLLERMLHMLKLDLEEASSVWRLSDQNFAQPFLPSEISRLPVQTACMDVISQAEGMMLYAQALELCGPQCRGLLRMAIPRLKRAVKVLQNSATAHHWLGQALYELAIREPDPDSAAESLREAKKHLAEAAKLTADAENVQRRHSVAQPVQMKEAQETQDYAKALQACDSAEQTLDWRKLMTLTGHEGSVEDFLVPLPHERQDRLISCSRDGTLRTWDLITFQQLHKTKAHKDPIWAITWVKTNPTSPSIASGGCDKVVRLWSYDEDSGQLGKQTDLLKHPKFVRSLHGRPDGSLLSGNDGGGVVCSKFNLGGEWTHTNIISADGNEASDRTQQISWIDSMPNCTDVIWGNWKAKVCRYDMEACTLKDEIQVGQNRLIYRKVMPEKVHQVLAVPGEAPLCLVALESGPVALVDFRQREVAKRFEGHTGNTLRTCLFGDNSFLSCASDHQVRLWDFRQSKCSKVLEEHSDTVWSLCWHPGQNCFISGSRDSSIVMYGKYKAKGLGLNASLTLESTDSQRIGNFMGENTTSTSSGRRPFDCVKETGEGCAIF